jgi:hypothetical protein
MSKTQIVRCPKCKSVFAGCLDPYCYTDKDWLKNIRLYLKQGYEIDLIESKSLHFEKCKCNVQLKLSI